MIAADLRSRLEAGASSLGVDLDQNQFTLLCEYLALLQKWNKAYNLTAIKEIEQMLGLHILDSLAILPHLCGQTFIDVGTGAGLPGLILAMQNPSCSVTLLDSNGKKTRFLTQAKTELGLSNVEVVHSRVEAYRPENKFDGVLSRAFATLKDMTDNASPLVANNGRFWAMKGRVPTTELEDLGADIRLEKVIALHVPEVSAERHLVELSLA